MRKARVDLSAHQPEMVFTIKTTNGIDFSLVDSDTHGASLLQHRGHSSPNVVVFLDISTQGTAQNFIAVIMADESVDKSVELHVAHSASQHVQISVQCNSRAVDAAFRNWWKLSPTRVFSDEFLCTESKERCKTSLIVSGFSFN